MKWAALLLLSLAGCVGVGYHSRRLTEIKDENYKETMKWAEQVRDGEMTIYEMIRALKDRRFSRKI